MIDTILLALILMTLGLRLMQAQVYDRNSQAASDKAQATLDDIAASVRESLMMEQAKWHRQR